MKKCFQKKYTLDILYSIIFSGILPTDGLICRRYVPFSVRINFQFTHRKSVKIQVPIASKALFIYFISRPIFNMGFINQGRLNIR